MAGLKAFSPAGRAHRLLRRILRLDRGGLGAAGLALRLGETGFQRCDALFVVFLDLLQLLAQLLDIGVRCGHGGRRKNQRWRDGKDARIELEHGLPPK